MFKILSLALVLGGTAVILAACGGETPEPTSTPVPPTATPTPTPTLIPSPTPEPPTPTPTPTPEPAIDYADAARETVLAWVETEIDQLASVIVDAVMESPEVTEILESVPALLRGATVDLLEASISAQAAENLQHELSVAIPREGWEFVLTVTSTFTDMIEVPVLGEVTYQVEVPTEVTVDAEEREITDWNLGTVSVGIEK